VRLALFPLFHISGLGTLVAGLGFGQRSVWPAGAFDAARVIELTREHGITLWGGASTHLVRLLDHPDLTAFEHEQLAQVGIGGSASTPNLIARTEAAFPHLRNTFSSGYGMTESGGLISYAGNAELRAAPDCVGLPLPTVEVRITDPSGTPVADGEIGTIEARSPILMIDYWRPGPGQSPMLADGWMRTEDFGRLEHGVLFIESRHRDLIIRGGENVYPVEVEDCLESHPAVAEAAVIGVEDDEFGQVVHAVVVRRPGASVTDDELLDHCRARIAYFKVPATIEWLTEPLPRNAAGKVLKHELSLSGSPERR
jgi:acyl-CoA synthetase (AMP-forming)/AMP-acid ligase II